MDATQEKIKLHWQPWGAAAQAAFEKAYGDDAGMVEAHRQEVESGMEALIEAEGCGFFTARFEKASRIVLTGLAADEGFDEVLSYLEKRYAVVCVETYRHALLRMLKKRGYEVDHVRVFKRVQ